MKNKKPKIIIIGAGLSGLTVGYRLYQNECDIQIVEARNRVGGRVQTALLKNLEDDYSYAELGGQNISDAEDPQHILRLAKELGLDEAVTYMSYTPLFYDGQNYHDVNALFQKHFRDIVALEKKLHDLKKTNQSIENCIKFCAQNNPIIERILSFFLHSYEGSAINLLSVEHNIDILLFFIKRGLYQDDPKNEKIKLLSLKEGNARLPIKIAEILKNNIQLNKELISVSLSSTDQILLRFKDDTIEYCDKLVLTIPASVYKNIHFDENIIPQTHLNDIYKVQYGQHAKILMPIQHQDLKHNFVFNDDMIGFFNQDQKLLNMYFPNINHTNPILGENFSKNVSMLKNGYQTASFSKILPKIALDNNYSYYETPIYKSWSEDSFSLGSYSNFGIGLGKKFKEIETIHGINVKTMFMPVHNRVFFAGEHTTIIDEIGTMEAAVESGDRMAALIHRIVK